MIADSCGNFPEIYAEPKKILDARLANWADMMKRDSLLTYTRYLLRKWARISESQLPLLAKTGDYRSPGRGTRVIDTQLPPELQLIEITVNKADPKDRLILMTEYLRDWPAPMKYRYVGVSRSSYYRRLESAEMYVKHALD